MNAETVKSLYDIVTHQSWRALFSEYKVKVLDNWNGRHCRGMDAELHRLSDNKKIADIHVDANSGCMNITSFHKLGGPTTNETEEYNQFLAAIDALPASNCSWRPDESIPIDENMAIAVMAELDEYRKIVNSDKFLCIRPDAPDTVVQLQMPKGTSPEKARTYILREDPKTLILNEVL